MTPRERVQATLNFQQPDRVPVIIGVSNATGIKMETFRKIKKQLDINSEDRYLYDWPELGTALPDEEMMVLLKSDVRGVWDRFPEFTYTRNRQRAPHEDYIDDWGSGAKEISPGEWFPGVHPLADATTIKEVEEYPGWPDMNDPYRVAHVKQAAEALKKNSNCAIMATPWLLFPFERAYMMQGLDKFLLNMAMYPDFSEALLKKHLQLCKTLMGHFLAELGDNVDIIKIGDDLGTQKSLMISPTMYRKLLKPIHAEFISFIKKRTKAKVFFHTDGDVFDLIEDFIEIGVDILNPIQTSAGKMSNLPLLKEKFGDRIVLCGGIDTQNLLPSGSPEDIRKEVKRVINILGEGGGYMLSSVHTIMNDVPPENVMAMIRAVEE
jgi:uroporphyrinogen decarboxylase